MATRNLTLLAPLAAARDFSILRRPMQLSDIISPADRENVYQFRLTSTSHFSLALTEISRLSDHNFELLSSTGSVIAASVNGVHSNESISLDLPLAPTTRGYFSLLVMHGPATTYVSTP